MERDQGPDNEEGVIWPLSENYLATRRQILRDATTGATALIFSSRLISLLEDEAAAATVGRPGGILKYGLANFPPSLDPYRYAPSSFDVVYTTHRGLLGFNAKGRLRGELAASWRRLADNKTWIFRLRQNAVFHDGRPVTADDVVASLRRVLDPKAAAFSYAALAAGIKSIDAVDRRTVRITTNFIMANLPVYLAAYGTPIVSRRSLEADSATPQNWVGAGPFTYKSIQTGVSVEVAKFAKFYKPGFPRLAGIRFVVYADDSARTNALRVGDVDMIDRVPPEQMTGVARNKKLKLQQARYASAQVLQFNVTRPPFDNPLVRQALGFAIKRSDIVRGAFSGRALPLSGMPISPASPFHDKKLSTFWSYNPQRARRLLAQAGYRDGFSVTLLSTTTFGFYRDLAVIVQQNLKEIGIDVKLLMPDFPAMNALRLRGQYDFGVTASIPSFNDPDALSVSLATGGLTRSWGYRNPKMDELFSAARRTVVPSARKKIYARLQAELLKDPPILPLVWVARGFGFRNNVEGYSILPGFQNLWSGYALDRTTVR